MAVTNRTTIEPAPADVITSRDYERIRQFAYQRFGLNLSGDKQVLVASRITKLLLEQRLDSFEQYWARVESDCTGESLTRLIDALTTNFTAFRREPEHFDFLREVILADHSSRSPVKIWSAACATGEEPFSIAFEMVAEGHEPQILATDISTRALAQAECAIYAEDQTQTLPPDWLRAFFLRGVGKSKGFYQVKPEIRSRIRFRRFNLLDDLLPQESFAVIFCRNVLIYFDAATKERVIARLATLLEPGGYFFIGHSESLHGIRHSLSYVRPAIYQRPPGGGQRRRGRL